MEDKDLLLAKEILEKEKLSLVFVKDGKIIFKSDKKGIRPILEAYNEKKDLLKDSFLADKVVGRAALSFIEELGVKSFYTEIISREVIDYLKNKDIAYFYDEVVDKILNRDKTDLCPMEKISQSSSDNKEIILKIKKFLKEV
ncbi:DUF1893 domain-containing protein [Citroniella saccharovorans]|uniref:DUF1893 domain-containing protein n=1 Tax=Citroniella saccharovorans TaxID=2053367 RepID=A0AAW9MWM2_9FIRM|nr:DUF1893 domain-containing protein [Citroniella saccharovorans]MEB3428970.1 DUF1893 domain-containing protein [Citroniella saccharovorans]